MRLSEITKNDKVQTCPTCGGTKSTVVGGTVFDCSTCRGRGYFGPEHGMSKDDEELEERKVTKTMAGKQQRPIDKLAVDTKKKKPNQGKEPVELDKFKDTKDLANEILKGEYNQ